MLSCAFQLSPALASFCLDQNLLSRNDVAKFIRAYIIANKLKDPSDGRKIICDDALKSLLGVDTCTFFSLNKYLSPHFPLKKVKVKVENSENKRGNAFNDPMTLSAPMQDLLGVDALSRPQTVRSLWAYIKNNNLQVYPRSYDLC